MHNPTFNRAAVAVGLVVASLYGFAGSAFAQADPDIGTQVTDSMTDWSDQAKAMVPALLAAGLALFGVTLLVRFGKRVFGAAK